MFQVKHPLHILYCRRVETTWKIYFGLIYMDMKFHKKGDDISLGADVRENIIYEIPITLLTLTIIQGRKWFVCYWMVAIDLFENSYWPLRDFQLYRKFLLNPFYWQVKGQQDSAAAPISTPTDHFTSNSTSIINKTQPRWIYLSLCRRLRRRTYRTIVTRYHQIWRWCTRKVSLLHPVVPCGYMSVSTNLPTKYPTNIHTPLDFSTEPWMWKSYPLLDYLPYFQLRIQQPCSTIHVRSSNPGWNPSFHFSSGRMVSPVL